jgi:hypothetical protein
MQFVLALAQRVEWNEEREFARTMAEALADLYCLAPSSGSTVSPASSQVLPARPPGEPAARREGQLGGAAAGEPSAAAAEAAAGAGAAAAAAEEFRRREWNVRHVLLPALRLFLVPARKRASGEMRTGRGWVQGPREDLHVLW